jgi:hypothetical protein
MTRAVNPECRGPNHAKCDGLAWDENTDQLTNCGCRCHRSAVAAERSTIWNAEATDATDV